MSIRTEYREYLLHQLLRRKAANSNYSLRAFARDLNISVTALSDVLAKKRHLSKKNALKVADKLGLSPEETKHFVSQSSQLTNDSVDKTEYLQIQEDVFRLMSDWYYFAILNLVTISSNRADSKWIAKRLGISVLEAKSAVSCLKRLGYLAIDKGKLVRTANPIKTTHDVPSSALRSYHKQNLKLAEQSIDRDPVALRDFTSVTLATDPSKLKDAKTLLQRFRVTLTKALQSEHPTQVYTLSLQLFPVSLSIDDTKQESP